MSHRIAQIEATLKKALSQVLQRQISDPRIEGMISITKIEVTPNLAEAHVYVSVLPAEKQTRTLYGLRHAASHIHSHVRKLVALRRVPQLHFRLDESIKKQSDALGAIYKAMERTAESSQDASPPPEAPPEASADGPLSDDKIEPPKDD